MFWGFSLNSGWSPTSCCTMALGRTWSVPPTSSLVQSQSLQVTDHRHQLDSKLASLLRIVVEDSTRTKQGLDSLYRRLVTLLVLRLTVDLRERSQI